MKFIAKLLGIGREKAALARIRRFMRHPVSYFEETRDSKADLVNILTFAVRFYAIVKLAFLYPYDDGAEITLVILMFIFAYQLAFLMIWFNAFILNITARLTLNPSKYIATARAYVPSRLAPDFSTYFFGFYSLLVKICNPFQAFLILFAVNFIISKSILIVGLSKTYPMRYYKAVITTIIVYIGIQLGLIVVPLLWSIEFGPELVVRDVDLQILESTRYDLYTSHNGSRYLLNNLLQSADTSVIGQFDSLANTAIIPTVQQMKKLRILSDQIAPALQSTYFNRDSMCVTPPNGIADKSSSIYFDGTYVSQKYAAIWTIYVRGLLSNGEVKQALSLAYKSHSFFRAMGESDLGLVYAIQATVFIERINKAILSHLNHINSAEILDGFYHVVHTNTSDPEWVVNALRVEWLNHRNTYKKMVAEKMDTLMDSLGVPGISPYFMKKIFDLEDTYDIHDHIWARMLYLAKDTSSDTVQTVDFPELRWVKEGAKGKAKIALGKNIAGRIVTAVAIPIYFSYVHDARKSRRHAQFVAEAIRLRKHAITSRGNYSSFKLKESGNKRGSIVFDEESRTLTSTYIIAGDTTHIEFKIE